MLFDKFCGISERHCKHLLPILSEAALIEIPEIWEETHKRGVKIHFKEILEGFRMPFDCCAFEDPQGLVIMKWITERRGPGLVPEDRIRTLIFRNDKQLPGIEYDYVLIDAEMYYFSIANVDDYPEDAELIVTGAGKYSIDDANKGELPKEAIQIKFKLNRFSYGDKEKWHSAEVDDSDEAFSFLEKDLMTNFLTALRQAMVTIRPSHWILRTDGSAKFKSSRKGPVIPRSNERARYLLITDQEREHRFHKPVSTHQSPVPHPRRGHYRRISEVNEPLKHTWVRPTWVGEKVTEICGAKYEVMIDL